MNEKDIFIMKRRKCKVRLVDIAKYIGCSPSLLSRYENDDCKMIDEKIDKYRNYINEKCEGR